MPARRSPLAAGLVLLAALAALLPATSIAQDGDDDAAPSKWIQLYWGADGRDPGEFVESILDGSDLRITAIAQWDNGDQRWLLWRPGVPAFVNNFSELERGSIYWFRATYVGSGTPAFDISAAIDPKPEVDSGMVIEAEHGREGYDRRLFGRWIDADGDGCDTRREVLIRDAEEAPVVGARCSLSGGRWVSLYDGQVFTGGGSGLDIDHMVPLAEAWESGAWAWSPERRQAFANDLDNGFALLPVSASSNRSKGARDPAEWLPPDRSSHCAYATSWRDTKLAWGLTFDRAEADVLRHLLVTCGD